MDGNDQDRFTFEPDFQHLASHAGNNPNRFRWLNSLHVPPHDVLERRRSCPTDDALNVFPWLALGHITEGNVELVRILRSGDDVAGEQGNLSLHVNALAVGLALSCDDDLTRADGPDSPPLQVLLCALLPLRSRLQDGAHVASPGL